MPRQSEVHAQWALCPLCATPGLKPFTAFAGVPASGRLVDTPQSPTLRRDLSYAYCPACACVTQRVNALQAIDYTDVVRATARQLPDYAQRLIARMQREIPNDGLVLEVGCNDGTFLNELRSAGYTRRLGIEPSAALAAAARAAGHEVIQSPLDGDMARNFVAQHGSADLLICRHTVEHVPRPLDFLVALRTLLSPSGLACIEVPSSAPLIERLQIEELWDEHLTYFLPQNLTAALNKAGWALESLAIEPHRGMENLVVWARKANTELAPLWGRGATTLCANFGERWRRAAAQLRMAVAAAPRPRVAMGASHPQANFINFSGIADLVDATIDDDPAKTGRYLPLIGGAIPIHAGDALPGLIEGGTLLLTGFGYPQWMAAAQRAVRGHARAIIDVTPRCAELAPATV